MADVKIGRMVLGLYQTNCYFVYRTGHSEAIVIDPADNGDKIADALERNGFLTITPEGHLLLTDSGREIAERIYDRHRLLTEYFIGLGVSPETAEADACGIEHILSEETFARIRAHNDSRRAHRGEPAD